VIKHTSGKTNKVVDSLSRINLILQEFQFNTLGYDRLTKMCKEMQVSRMHMQLVKTQFPTIEVSGWNTCYKKECCSRTINCAYQSVQ